MLHLVAYTARVELDIAQGVAEVLSDRRRPSWRECAEQIPGFFTGSYLGLAPKFTLRYRTSAGVNERSLTRPGVERVGAVVMRLADRDEATEIEVLDEAGLDVTFNFACFV